MITKRGAVPHERRYLEVSLPDSLLSAVKRDGALELGYVTGGGGGHSLVLVDGKVEIIKIASFARVVAGVTDSNLSRPVLSAGAVAHSFRGMGKSVRGGLGGWSFGGESAGEGRRAPPPVYNANAILNNDVDPIAAFAVVEQVQGEEVWGSVANGHIACAAGSIYLNDDSVTEIMEDVTTEEEARQAVRTLSEESPDNPVVLWQLANPWSDGATIGNTPSEKMYLVVHREKFIRMAGVTMGSPREFAETIATYQPDRVWGSPLYFREG